MIKNIRKYKTEYGYQIRGIKRNWPFGYTTYFYNFENGLWYLPTSWRFYSDNDKFYLQDKRRVDAEYARISYGPQPISG